MERNIIKLAKLLEENGFYVSAIKEETRADTESDDQHRSERFVTGAYLIRVFTEKLLEANVGAKRYEPLMGKTPFVSPIFPFFMNWITASVVS
jgi:hypothetical protein